MLREGARSGGQKPAEIEDALRIRRLNLAAEAKRLGITGKLRAFGDERGMANTLGRLDEYHSYLFATQLTHGAESAFIFDPDPVGDRNLAIVAASVELSGVALSLSVVSVLRSHIDTAEMLNWPGVPEAQALLEAPLPPAAQT
jgi:hypothetical protein